MIQHLPEDIQRQLLSLMSQSDIAHLAVSCRVFHQLAEPLLYRQFRCVSCRAALFHPRELDLSDVRARANALSRGPTNKQPRRNFFRLRERGAELPPGALSLDNRRGAPNFHVIRELAQTVCRSERFPLQTELQAVRALRCDACGVFVGFRHEDIKVGETHDFIHWDFVELVDADGRLKTLGGDMLPEAERSVTCATHGCRQVLFQRDDMLPWMHVLASTRLTDMDPYLEWDHSWAGQATASQPAFFVKRLSEGAVVVRNVRAEQLRQGNMEVADVHCGNCDAQVGWKFVSELPDTSSDLLLNYDQIGRFGIIRNAVAPADPRYTT